jgi:hypothetical protein
MCNLRRILATACMLCLFTLPGSSGSRGADADWRYNRTLAGDRFSPLKEIDRSNVGQGSPEAELPSSPSGTLQGCPTTPSA